MSVKEWSPNKKLLIVAGVFIAAYFIPFDLPWVSRAVNEAFLMLGDYAREHVLLCLVPAMFIAGAITVFLDQRAVMHYLGPDAKRSTAYGVASVSGAILAVCSCTVLPIFKGIYKKGAGLGPAVAFLYSGPAINILAIVLSAKVFGWELGLARAVGAVLFSIIIGVIMALVFREDDAKRTADARMFAAGMETPARSLGQMVLYMGSMIVSSFSLIGQAPGAVARYGTRFTPPSGGYPGLLPSFWRTRLLRGLIRKSGRIGL